MDHRRFARTALTALLWTSIAYSAVASEAYRPITATTTNRTITLTGHDLTIDQVVDIARHGAKVAVRGATRGDPGLPLQSSGRLGPRNCNDDRRSGLPGKHGQVGRSP